MDGSFNNDGYTNHAAHRNDGGSANSMNMNVGFRVALFLNYPNTEI